MDLIQTKQLGESLPDLAGVENVKPETKRGRGRPRSKAPLADSLKSTVIGGESVNTEPKRGRGRPRSKAPLLDNVESNATEDQSSKTEPKQRKSRSTAPVSEDVEPDVPGVESIKAEPKQRRRRSKLPLTDNAKSDLDPELPPWKGSWGNKHKDTISYKPELAIAEGMLGKRKGSATSGNIVFAEGGRRRPRGAAIQAKTELSDIIKNRDSLENVGVKIVWSQKDVRRIVTSPYLCKGTRLQDLGPLTRSLFEEYKKGEKKADYKRVNVVSDQLCGKERNPLLLELFL